MSGPNIVFSFLVLGVLTLTPLADGQAIFGSIGAINSLATQSCLQVSNGFASLPVSAQLVSPRTLLSPLLPQTLVAPVVQSLPTLVVAPVVPNCGYAVPTLPPAPPAVGCTCGNGYSFLRKCTILPPFL